MKGTNGHNIMPLSKLALTNQSKLTLDWIVTLFVGFHRAQQFQKIVSQNIRPQITLTWCPPTSIPSQKVNPS